MTREEARKIAGSLDFVDALEALGLLKFDEPVIIASPSYVIKDVLLAYAGSPMLAADAIVNALMREGYIIVRKGTMLEANKVINDLYDLQNIIAKKGP